MEDNVYKAPEADLKTPQPDGSLASRWKRLGAAIIDGLTYIPIMLPLMYFTGGFDGVTEGAQPSLLYTFIIGIVSAVVFMLIHGYFLLNSSQTIGKKVLGITIATMNGEPAPTSHLIKRYGFYLGIALIPVVGSYISFVSILFIFGKAKRCIHDYVGGTQVINK